jgi:hypothetical protein
VASRTPGASLQFGAAMVFDVELARLRRRMPLVVFLLLALVCLALIGFACACLTDQPALAIERALQGPALAPAVVAVWAVLLAVLFPAAAGAVALPRGRASPALLQRFLF